MTVQQNRRGRPAKYRASAPIVQKTRANEFREGSKAHELQNLVIGGIVTTPQDWYDLGGRSYVFDILIAAGTIQIDQFGASTVISNPLTDTDSPEEETQEAPQPEPIQAIEDDGEVLPEWFDRALQIAKLRQNLLMTGPSGSGKTYIAEKIAEKMELPFAMQSCSVGMSESNLVGYLLPTGEQNAMEYHPSPFVQCYEDGGVFLLDEFDAADPNTTVFINAALAGELFTIPQRFRNPTVRRHKDFVCIAATNTLDGASPMYTGRNPPDAATFDRFRTGICVCGYSPNVEQKLSDPMILSWGRAVRGAIAEGQMMHIMSTRSLIQATEQYRNGIKFTQIKESYFADWSAEEKSILARKWR